MSALRVIGWTLLALLAGAAIYLIATIRVVEPSPAAPPPAASGPGQAADGLLVPVEGIDIATLRSNWGDARGRGARVHQALDIMAPAGARVLAAADGTIEKLYFSKGGGGITLYQRAASGDLMLYYAHLRAYATGMAEGRRVRAGELIGYVGDSGNAGAGNYHLHFAVAQMGASDRWWQGRPVDPYPLLASARRAR